MDITQDKFFSQAYTISKTIQENLVTNSDITIDEECFCPDELDLNDNLIQTYETRSPKIAESIIKVALTGKKVLAIAFNPSINSTEEDGDDWADNVKRREERNKKELKKYKEFLNNSDSQISYNKKWEYLSKSKTKEVTGKNKNKDKIKVRERFENFDTTRRNLLISIFELFSKNDTLKSMGLKEMIVADLIPFRTKKEKEAYDGRKPVLKDNFNNIKELCGDVDIIIPCWGSGMNSYFNKEHKDTRKKFQESFENRIRPVLDSYRDKIYFLNPKVKVRPIHPASQSKLSLIKLENNSDLILTL